LLNKTAKTAANNKVLIRYDWLYLVRVNMQLTMAERRKSTCAMNATMSRVNGIFNKDLAVRLVLIANNDAIVYLDAATDPYSAATTGAAGAWSQEAQTTQCDWGGNYDMVICSGLPVEVEMLDASAACVFHLLLIFRWVKEVLTLRLQMGFHKAILILILLCMK
jgi:hypothetical protein